MTGQFSKFRGDHGSEIPSMLQVSDFFMARANSVVKLYTSARPGARIIPRHLRRRLRSFKPYHHRPKAPKVASAKQLSRRTRRRRGLSQVKTRRLPVTHLWHAKRFHMENIWDMRLPMTVCNKGERAFLRRSKRMCVVHDRSYMDCWRLEGDANSLIPKLTEIGIVGMISKPKVVNGQMFGNGFIRNETHLVSPYQALWTEQMLYVWTHPSARPEVQPLLESAGATHLPDAVRFELIGARAKEVLVSVGIELPENSIPAQMIRSEDGLILNSRADGYFIDIIVSNISGAFNLWQKLVFAGASAVGVLDRHKLMTTFGAPDFPFDFPSSKAGSRWLATRAKKLVLEDQQKPPQCRMNSGSVESPFFPDWTLLGLERVPPTSSLQSVVIVPKRGEVKDNAHVYCEDKLIGFITTGVGEASSRGVGSIICHGTEALHEVSYRNPGSVTSFDANILKCSCSSTDSSLLTPSR